MSQIKRSNLEKLVYLAAGLGFVFLGIAFTGQLLGSKWGRAQNSEEEGSSVEGQAGKPTMEAGSQAAEAKSTQNSSGLDLPTDEQPPVFDASSDYRYEPVGKRDPFRPFRDAKIGIGQVRQTTRSLEPLERFDIKTLEVVAIVWANDKPKALIQDPDKQVHSVVKGQRIGKNEGYIAEIREGEIVVIELYDLNGKVVKEPYVMCIDKRKGCGSL